MNNLVHDRATFNLEAPTKPKPLLEAKQRIGHCRLPDATNLQYRLNSMLALQPAYHRSENHPGMLSRGVLSSAVSELRQRYHSDRGHRSQDWSALSGCLQVSLTIRTRKRWAVRQIRSAHRMTGCAHKSSGLRPPHSPVGRQRPLFHWKILGTQRLCTADELESSAWDEQIGCIAFIHRRTDHILELCHAPRSKFFVFSAIAKLDQCLERTTFRSEAFDYALTDRANNFCLILNSRNDVKTARSEPKHRSEHVLRSRNGPLSYFYTIAIAPPRRQIGKRHKLFNKLDNILPTRRLRSRDLDKAPHVSSNAAITSWVVGNFIPNFSSAAATELTREFPNVLARI